MATKYQQGLYTLKNPYKYLGDASKVRFMSSWELQVFNYMDNNPNVIKWSSEEVAITYLKPTDNRLHKYYPDILVLYRDNTGVEKWELIEIKPKAQTKPSRAKSPKVRLYQNITLAVNMAKFAAAQQWCEAQQANGISVTFRILTENQIFK